MRFLKKKPESFENPPELVSVSGGTLGKQHLNIALLDQALVSAVNFLSGILLARFLGVKAFGTFSLLWLAFFFVNTLLSALVTMPMQSLGPKMEDKAEVYYGAAFCLQMVYTVLITGITLLGFLVADQFWFHWQIAALLPSLFFVCLTFQLQEFTRRLFYTNHQSVSAFQSDCISYGGQIAGLILLAVLGCLTVENALWVMGATSLLAALWIKPSCFAFECNTLGWVSRRNWELGSWLLVTNLFQWLGTQGILLVATGPLGLVGLGGVRAVINMLAPLNLLLQGMQNVVPVQASRLLQEKGTMAMRQYFLKVSGVTLVVVAGLCSLIVLSGSFLMEGIYGADYEQFTPYIAWQASYTVLIAINLLQIFYFRTIEQTRLTAIAQMVAAPLAIYSAWASLGRLAEGAVFLGLMINSVVFTLVCGLSDWLPRPRRSA